MIDVHLVVYLGVLVLFLGCAAAISLVVVLVFTTVAVVHGIRGRRKRPAPVGAPFQGAIVGTGVGSGRAERVLASGFLGWAVTLVCRPTQPSGECPPLTPDDDLPTGCRREESAGTPGGTRKTETQRVPPIPNHKSFTPSCAREAP